MNKFFYRIAMSSDNSREKLREAEAVIKGMRDALDRMCSDFIGAEETAGIVGELIKSENELRKGRLFWDVINDPYMPGDAREEFVHQPTYCASAILLRAFLTDPQRMLGEDGFAEALKKGLAASADCGFYGSGIEGLLGLFDALELLGKAGAADFVRLFPKYCPNFTEVFRAAREKAQHILDRYDEYNTAKTWDKPPALETVREICGTLTGYGLTAVFVYGTLMDGQPNHRAYLGTSKAYASAKIKGFGMYDLGSYPAIVHGKRGWVLGEIYLVDAKAIKRMDRLEGEGELYSREPVGADLGSGLVMAAEAYVFLHSVEGHAKVTVKNQPWRSGR